MKSKFDKGNVVKRERQAPNHLSQATTHSPFRIWREPLIHFFILGLGIFGLHAVLDRKPEGDVNDPYLVEISSADIEWVRTMWNKRMGREPTTQDLRVKVTQLIREKILNREAVGMGLDKGDIVVRRRLVQKMEFLFKDLSDMAEPLDGDLRQYLEENRHRYEIPKRLTFTHIYFNTDQRGQEGAVLAVNALLKRLKAEGDISLNAPALGDPSLLQSYNKQKTPWEIRREFGTEFTDTVMNLAPLSWHGPVTSGYGLHAVYIHERLDARLPDFSEISDQLKFDWMAEKQREITRRAYKEIRSRYRVLVENMPYDLDVHG